MHSVVSVEEVCSTVIQQLGTNDLVFSTSGGIIAEARSLALSFQFITFCYVRQVCNNLAHLIEKFSESDQEGATVLPSGRRKNFSKGRQTF